MTKSIEAHALTGVRWSAASRIALQLAIWPITIVVMRLLDAGDYGLMALATIVIGFVALFSELGLGLALVQARELDDTSARAATAAVVGFNAGVALLLVALAPLAAAAFGEPALQPVMQLLALEPLLAAFGVVPQALLERRLRFRELSIAQLAAGLTGAACTLAAALSGLGVWSLVAGALATSTLRTALAIGFHGSAMLPRSLSLAPIRPLARFGGHVIGARALWYWYGQADQLILGRLLHASALGYYSVAAQFAMLPVTKVMAPLNQVAFPLLSRLAGERPAMQAAYRRLIGLIALYAVGLCWGLAAVAGEFVQVLLGDKWAAAALPLAALALVAPLRMLSVFHNTVVTAAGTPRAATVELAAASVLMPVAIVAGVLAGGLPGAALAWLAAFPLVYLLSARLTAAALGLRLADALRPLVEPVAAGAAMLAGIALLRWQLAAALPTAALLALEIAAGAALYALALRAFAPALLAEGNRLLRELLRPKAPA